MAIVQNSGVIAGTACEELQQYGAAIPCRMTGICSLNRRVRSRMHGGVGGREAFSYPDLASPVLLPHPFYLMSLQ
jgi:hypothetical protein